MRALRDPDAFLPSDLGVRHALEQLGQDGRPAAAARLAERWRPYRAYALQHLWASLQPAKDEQKSSEGSNRSDTKSSDNDDNKRRRARIAA